AISFLASCTHATLTPEIKTYDEANQKAKARSGTHPRNANNHIISNSQTQRITITGSGSHSVTIETDGTLKPRDKSKVIYVNGENSNTLTLTNLTNKGTIDGQVAIENKNNRFTGTITVNAFENTKQINGQIYMGIWAGRGTINVDKFNNSGTIAGSNGRGVYFQGNTNIKSFSNSGFINANKSVDIGNEA
ncbi:hypothetical protein AJ935_00750, partial [Campylobacter sp. BCW_6876]